MNKRVLIFWLLIIPITNIILFFIFQNYFSDSLRTLLMVFMIISIILFPYYLIFVSPFLCSPKNKLPRDIKLYNFGDEIECKQITRSIYEVSLGDKKLKIDMTSWIFKRLYIRDILLMYYHLSYYNSHKLPSFKCNSKKYFKGENKYISFQLLNEKKVKIPMIKKGKEKRTILCDFKIFMLSGSLDRRMKYKKDKYYINYVTNFYV